MPILTGKRLGPYEILSLIGVGGMGEVYRAKDTRLDRIVAIKVLPSHLADSSELRERFEREARTIASLNHPHICTLYDIGHQDGTDFLVMEYLEGKTLGQRLVKGPLPLEQILQYAIEIAEALDKAHRKGVTHRDIKPGNVMLTKAGTKLLDFGLAKLKQEASPAVPLSQLPTAEKDSLTAHGTIMGTLQYMAPEQVEGKQHEIDARTDIFAFGAVVYEMVTGKKAFEGKTSASVMAKILELDPPPMSSLEPMTPPALDRLVKRCLAKEPDKRWQTASDLCEEFKWIAEGGAAGPETGEKGLGSPGKRRRDDPSYRLLAAVAAVALAAAIALAIGFVLRAPKPLQPLQPVRLSAEIGADASLYTALGSSAVLSPDGTRLALVASGSDQKRRIYVRALDQSQATALSGTENAGDPFFSPDGQWIGFFADGKMKKISVQGGAAVTLCDAPTARGGSWGEDGTIVFNPGVIVALSKVSSAGGAPQPLTTLDKQAGEVTQHWPQVLPGGKAVLFTSGTDLTNLQDAEIVVYSIASGQRKTVQRGGFYGRYLSSGHLVYMRQGTLFAVPFDLKRLEVTGQPVPILEGVANSLSSGGAQFSFSETGSLAYVAGGGGGQNVAIYWLDRQGKFTPLREAPADYRNPALSPDGKRLALDISDGKRRDVWVYEWERDTLTRLTFAGENNGYPVWTPDGQRIAYSSQEKGGVFNLWWIRADGAGDAQRLTQSKYTQLARSWRPDGKVLAFPQDNPNTNWDVMTLTFEGNEKSWKPGEPKPFVNSAFNDGDPAFSPDGRWLAYEDSESGRFEVYVRAFPGPGGKWQISTGGGGFPKWSRNGKELFYLTGDNKLMVATYTVSGDSFRADKPQLWSPGQLTGRPGNYNYDLHPDGKRVVVLKALGTEQNAAVNKVNVVLNWFDELKQKVPVGAK